MKSYLSLTLVVLALCAGCRTTPVQPTKPAAHPTGAPAAAAVAARPIPQLGAPTLLTGKVKLISDRGGAVVSNNGSGAISDNGAGAISDNGAGVISNNGSGLAAAKAGHMVIRVLAAAPTETLLADARIEVLDATGATLGDENGRPLVATSGRDGSFQLRAVLPPEAVVLRVRLSTAVVRKGGELRAIVARDAGNATLDLDTAASLGAGYVLERLVKGQVGVLERLPAQNARDLKTAITAALTAESRPSDYAPAALAGQVAVLREANEGVRTELERIEAILLAGVSNLGVGLPATAVALIDPQAVTSDGTGGLLIAERTTGRIRQLKADGTMALYTDALDGRFKVGFGTITQIRRAADGALYVAQQGPSGVQRLLPDGRLEPLIGAGAQAGGPDVEPNTIALAADGTLWIGQAYPRGILSRAPDGQVAPLPWPDTFPAGGQVVALELATDGVLWALWVPDDANTGPFSGRLARRDPAGSWQMVAGALGCASRGGLAADSAGAMLVAADREHKVWRIASDGTRSLVAGTGEIGDEGDGGAATAARLTNPHGLWRAEDGSVYVVEPVSGVVRAIAPDGKIRTAAGARGVVRVGGAVRVALAAPTGVALDPGGHVVVAETASGLVKRIVDDRVEVVAGSLRADATNQARRFDDRPPFEAQLGSPVGIAYGPDGALWICDSAFGTVSRLGADGVLRVLAGGGTELAGVVERPGRRLAFVNLYGVAVGPDNAAYIVAVDANQIVRVAPDGATRVVAGAFAKEGVEPAPDFAGDGGLANAPEARLCYPAGLAFKPGANPPELYVADAANMRVRKITDPGGPAARIDQVVGKPLLATLADLDRLASTAPTTAAEALLAAPLSLCFDAAGAMYVVEGGTKYFDARGVSASLAGGLELPKVPARIRKFAPDGTVTTLAGPGGRVLAGRGDDSLVLPFGILIDLAGSLVLADGGANQLKLIPAAALR